MMRYTISRVFCVSVLLVLTAAFMYWCASALVLAKNITTFTDLITDSRPSGLSDHTFTFEIKQAVSAGGYFEFALPSGFNIPASDTVFGARNVEMYVNGVPRLSSTTLSTTLDQVVITPGDGGTIRYNLNTTTGISADSDIEVRVGSHTSTALPAITTFSTSTGTTTTPADAEAIENPPTKGTYKIPMTVGGTAEETYTSFVVAIIDPINLGPADTTEEIPPYRFNGAPDGDIGGTTLFVEISLETDEFAICRYSQTASTTFPAMTGTFNNTGKVFHRHLVAVVPDSLNTYYIRCIDDEGNYNIDDFIIAFYAPASPAGQSNQDGDVEGDGSGTGDSGTGDGDGSGGTTGSSDGGQNTTGGSSGSGGGGGGGGSGGTSGSDNQDQSGGGFESVDGPYPSGDAEVIIRGYAFPGSTVYALVDGNQAESVRASSDGSYSVTLEEISRGVYTFGVYAVDSNGTKSSTFSTSFTVTGGKTSNLSNVNIMPSIRVTPDPVDVGGTVTFTGYSIPNAAITLETLKDGPGARVRTFTATSDARGAWTIDQSTSGFTAGTYKVRAKAKGEVVSTNYSDYTYYGVGQEANQPPNADLNRDGKVNLTDFSILLFWWGGDGGTSDPPADINQDGRVSLTDFSIMLFQWTG